MPTATAMPWSEAKNGRNAPASPACPAPGACPERTAPRNATSWAIHSSRTRTAAVPLPARRPTALPRRPGPATRTRTAAAEPGAGKPTRCASRTPTTKPLDYTCRWQRFPPAEHDPGSTVSRETRWVGWPNGSSRLPDLGEAKSRTRPPPPWQRYKESRCGKSAAPKRTDRTPNPSRKAAPGQNH